MTVTPDIAGIALLEFDRAADAIRVGAEAAKAALPDIDTAGSDLQADQFDRIRDLRKHETT